MRNWKWEQKLKDRQDMQGTIRKKLLEGRKLATAEQVEAKIYELQVELARKKSFLRATLPYNDFMGEPPKLREDFLVEAVVGFRFWRVPFFEKMLQSYSLNNRWKPYERLEAKCESAGGCSGFTCGCGIHAMKSLPLARGESRYASGQIIYGTVSLWGRIIECDNGYRAQYAYPKEIYDTGPLASEIAKIYGVRLVPEGPCVR